MVTFESIKAFFDISSQGIFIKLIAAVSIAVVGLLVGYIVGKLVRKLLHEFEVNNVLKEQGLKIPVEELVASLVRYIIYLIAFIFALSQLGLRTFIFSVILAIIFILIIAFIILAIKDFVPNMAAGFYIHQKQLFKKGDRVRIGTSEGIVIQTDLAETRLKLDNDDIVYIPNSFVVKSQFLKMKK